MKKILILITLLVMLSCSDNPTEPKKEEIIIEFNQLMTSELANAIWNIRRDSGLVELENRNTFKYDWKLNEYFDLAYRNNLQQNYSGNQGLYESLSLRWTYFKYNYVDGYPPFQERYELLYCSNDGEYSGTRLINNIEDYLNRNINDFLIPTHRYIYITVFRVGEYVGIYTATCYQAL